MTAKHTPGPWHIGMKPGPMIYGEHGEQVADMVVSMINIVEHSANARLIAAAPDLLQALENLTDAVQSGTSYADDTAAGKALSILSGRSGTTWLSDARAAIAKAKGE